MVSPLGHVGLCTLAISGHQLSLSLSIPGVPSVVLALLLPRHPISAGGTYGRFQGPEQLLFLVVYCFVLFLRETQWQRTGWLGYIVFLRTRFALLAARSMLVSCLAYSSTLKMDVVCSSQTPVDFDETTRCCVQEGRACYVLTSTFFQVVKLCRLVYTDFIASLRRTCLWSQLLL
jgi:hypothetical protein